jgi:hypothetical protein
MPEHFNYTKQSNPYEQFAHHLPIYARPMSTHFFAESIENPLFTIRFTLLSVILEIGSEKFHLVHDSTPSYLSKFWIRDFTSPAIATQQTLDEFYFNITFEASNYHFTRTKPNRILTTETGEELATFANAWRDSDAEKNIKHWIHCQQSIPTPLLALFFYAARTWTIPQGDTY